MSQSVTSTLVTERTILRPFAVEDTQELLNLFQEPAIRRYLLDDTQVELDWVAAEIEASNALFIDTGAGLWSVMLEARDEIVGFTGFREFFDPPQLQLLYGLHPRHWGRGIATEVAASVCQYAFEKLDFTQIAAAIDVPNTASKNVLERLGMRLLRVSDEGVAGTAFYTVDRTRWLAQHEPTREP